MYICQIAHIYPTSTPVDEGIDAAMAAFNSSTVNESVCVSIVGCWCVVCESALHPFEFTHRFSKEKYAAKSPTENKGHYKLLFEASVWFQFHRGATGFQILKI